MSAPTEAELKAVLAHPDDLTAYKAASIMRRDGSRVTGFVCTSESGTVGIVDQGAVRWLTRDEMWNLMHPENP